MPWLRSQLLELRRGRPLAVAVVAAFVVMSAVGFLPLFGGPGYEHALATGLLLPGLTAATTALDLTRPGRILPSALGALLEGARNGAILASISLATAVLHLVHVRTCDPFGQVPLFFLTAFFGCVLRACTARCWRSSWCADESAAGSSPSGSRWRRCSCAWR